HETRRRESRRKDIGAKTNWQAELGVACLGRDEMGRASEQRLDEATLRERAHHQQDENERGADYRDARSGAALSPPGDHSGYSPILFASFAGRSPHARTYRRAPAPNRVSAPRPAHGRVAGRRPAAPAPIPPRPDRSSRRRL